MRTRLVSAFAAVSVAALALAGCSAPGGDTAPAEDAPVLNLGSLVPVNSWDPAQFDGQATLYVQAVYDNLIFQEPDGSFSPSLATAWEYDDSQTELTLTLRDDVTFSDGSTFDATVAQTNLERFQRENGPLALKLATVTSIAAPNATTLVLTLAAPDPSLIVNLAVSAGWMASAEAIAAGSLATTPAGSGPYTLDAAETVIGSTYNFDRTTKYWGDLLPYGEVNIAYLPDSNAQLNALKSGQIDAVTIADQQAVMEAAQSGFEIVPSGGDWVGIALYDRAGVEVPALADVRVRQAIAYATDRRGIFETFFGGEATGTFTQQIWGPGTLGFDPEIDSAYEHDVDRAKALLAEAGYADGFVLPMPFFPLFGPDLPSYLVDMFAEVGITVEYTNLEMSQLFPAILQGQFPASLGTNSFTDDWTTMTEQIAGAGLWNVRHVTDPVAEELIVDFQFAAESERPAIAQELNRYVSEQAWFVPFAWGSVSTAMNAERVTAVGQFQQRSPWLYSFAPAE